MDLLIAPFHALMTGDSPFARAMLEQLDRRALRYHVLPRRDPLKRSIIDAHFTDGKHHAHAWVEPRGDKFAITCNCALHMPCDHLAALFVDIAFDPMMAALLRDESVAITALNESTRATRMRTSDDYQANIAVNLWLLGGRKVVDSPIIASVDFTEMHLGEHTLLLSLRRDGEKSRIDPRELPELRLPPPFEALVALADPHRGTRKALAFTGASGAIVLDALRTFPIELTKGGHALSFDPRSVSLVLTVEQAEHRRAVPRASEPDERLRHIVTRWRCEDGTLLSEASGPWFFPGPSAMVVDVAQRKIFSAHGVDPALVARRKTQMPLVVPTDPKRVAVMYARLRQLAPGLGLAPPSRASFGLEGAETPDLELRITGSPLDLRAELTATYSFGPVALTPDEPSAPHPARDLDEERRAFDLLLSMRARYDAEQRAFVAAQDEAGQWWTVLVPTLRADPSAKIRVAVADNLRAASTRRSVKSRAKVSYAQDWFELDARFTADDVSVDPETLRDALAARRRWIALDDGTLAELTDAARPALSDLLDAMGTHKGPARLSRFELGRIDRLADGDSVTLDERASRIRERFRALAVATEPRLSPDVRCALRPYQAQAVAWLQFLDELGVGGVLADDMGLGKTVVTISYLAERKDREGAQCSLVLAPASVVSNWKRECERFAPSLRVATLQGAARAKMLERADDWDVIVASYGVLRADIDQLRARSFRAVIFDEAQFLKNAASATADCARSLTARTRIALTGTPVENHLGELWSIVDQVNTGMLQSARDFEKRYGRPIADGDSEASARLRAITRPFILRRTKREVLRELPDKEEINQIIPMTAGQRAFYDGIARVVREDVDRAVREKGAGASALHVLTALLRLRQSACDPALIDSTFEGGSGKREAFVQLVRELVGAGRRALVFSQFTSLLGLWKQALDREGIRYEYLDGATVDRDKRVRAFQEGDAPLFLLSLKAGGTGLNLTAADTVIHLDPWWNPAVEEQATDRAHRMGQTRKVTVYRLVSEGSVEEKIQRLQAHKRGLADAIVREDSGALSGLTDEDVQLLLAGADGLESESEPAESPAASEAAAIAKVPKRRGRPAR